MGEGCNIGPNTLYLGMEEQSITYAELLDMISWEFNAGIVSGSLES